MISGRRLLPALLVGALVGRAASGAVLERVEVEFDGGAGPVVRLQLSAPVAAQSQTLPARAGQRDRVVVDLPGTTVGSGARGVVAGRGVLLRVRTGQFDADTARVVLDLEEPVQFQLGQEGDVVTVTLPAPPGQGAPVPPTIPAVPRPPLPSATRSGPPPTVPGERGPYLDYAPGEITPLPAPPEAPSASRPGVEPRLR